ncbi:50S ribosomal protein L29 [bacterium]|jgi:large subunit ribosomal protein L29|nr:50S ribosomal protein L29 [bacterium]
MKTRELRVLTDDQLADNLRDAAKQMFQLRFRAATEKLNAPSELRELRRRIARIKTLQRERELVQSRTEQK